MTERRVRNVMLIGDGIRQLYQDYVVKTLGDVFHCWWPEHSCGNSVQVLQHLAQWLTQHQPELIHLNCGLEDVRTVSFDNDEPLIPLAHYTANLERIFTLIRSHSSAGIIWATTTPINEQAHQEHIAPWQQCRRLNQHVHAYNAAALAVCARFGVVINDCCRAVEAFGSDQALADDGLHLSEQGASILGELVAGCVCTQLM